jgi:multiple sugar transport system substrate-binding protein
MTNARFHRRRRHSDGLRIVASRWLAALLLLAMGCAARAEKITISYMGWGSPQEAEISRSLLAEFERRNPNIHVKYILAPNFEDKLRTMMAGDIPPDVFYMPVESFPIYVSKNTLLDMDPYIRDSRFDTGDFFPQLLSAFKYKGRIYGLPKDFSTQVLYFNKDLFDRDGVAYPTNDWTWADMLAAAKKLTHDFDGDGRIDQFGVQYLGGTRPTYAFFRQAGARMFTPDMQRFALNSPDALRAFQFLYDLDYKYRVALTTSAAAGRDAQAEFSNGRLAMFLGYGRWLVPRFREMNKFRWDVTTMPHEKNRGCIIFTVEYSIAAKTKHPKESWELVKFLTGPAGQAQNSSSGSRSRPSSPWRMDRHSWTRRARSTTGRFSMTWNTPPCRRSHRTRMSSTRSWIRSGSRFCV